MSRYYTGLENGLATHPNRGTQVFHVPSKPSKQRAKASPSPLFSLSIPSKGCWISHTRKAERRQKETTCNPHGSIWEPLKETAPSHYGGGTNTVSCKLLHLELHFDSTLSNFKFCSSHCSSWSPQAARRQFIPHQDQHCLPKSTSALTTHQLT